MNDYIIRFNKGETFKRSLTWTDSQGVNLLDRVDSVSLELSSPTTISSVIPLEIEDNKVVLYFSHINLNMIQNRIFHIYANMLNGDRLLIMKGEFKAND